MSRAVRSVCVAVAALAVSASLSGTRPAAARVPWFSPGSGNGGDPYFPLQGNGGYDAQHYDIVFSYDPATRRMAGSTSLRAVATQYLSRFNLDFGGLVVRDAKVNGAVAAFRQRGQELTARSRDGSSPTTAHTSSVPLKEP